MITMVTKEYREEDLAVRTIIIKFFCIPLFKFKKTSTNNIAVQQLTAIKKRTEIKGLNYEVKD